jgi:uncharacterized protein (DUF488 family)
MRVQRIWTIGHSTRTADEFVALLRSNDISGVADVRTIPRSRRHPHFGLEALDARLGNDRIAYRHFPGLGGLRKPLRDSPNDGWKNASFRGYADHMQTSQFSGAIEELLKFAEHRRIAVMCAEAVWWQCHRMLLSDALLARDVDVQHIMAQRHRPGESTLQPHRLTPFARVDTGQISGSEPRVWYPRNQTGHLRV